MIQLHRPLGIPGSVPLPTTSAASLKLLEKRDFQVAFFYARFDEQFAETSRSTEWKAVDVQPPLRLLRMRGELHAVINHTACQDRWHFHRESQAEL